MIKKIGVIGGGTMGHGIAETFAMYGYDVNLYEPDSMIRSGLPELFNKEFALLSEEDFIRKEDIPEILDRIMIYSDLREAVSDRDYIIEAIPEIMEIKHDLFKKLDEFCPEHTFFASNTSSLKLVNMMEAVNDKRKERMIVNHWYNPAHIMPIAELSCFGNMPEPLFNEILELYKSIGKQPVRVLKDVPGLIANRIQQAIAREVFSLIEMGVALPGDIDRALKYGPAFRYATTGQLEIADFGGLDIWDTVGDNLLGVMDNSKQANSLLKQKVLEGKLGLKSGEGFYIYPEKEVDSIRKKYFVKLIKQLKASEKYI